LRKFGTTTIDLGIEIKLLQGGDVIDPAVLGYNTTADFLKAASQSVRGRTVPQGALAVALGG